MAHIDNTPMGKVDRHRKTFAVRVRELGRDESRALAALFPEDQRRILEREIESLAYGGELRGWSIDDFLDTLAVILVFNRAAAPFMALRSGEEVATSVESLAEADPRLLFGLVRTNPFGVLDRLVPEDVAGLLESEDRKTREAAIALTSAMGPSKRAGP